MLVTMRRQGSQVASGPRVDTALQQPLRQPLEALFDPSSIAVVGASDDPSKWGHILARRALESSGDRPVTLVNRAARELLGRPSYPTLVAARADGAAVDLVVVCVPSAGLVDAVRDAVEAGARTLVVITAGLSETGADGVRTEQEVLRIARAAGVGLVGPNCIGLVDTGTSLQLTHALLPPGDVTVLSQSGNIVLDLAALLEDRGLGVARFVSVGNQADVSVVDLMESCVTHAGTRAVALYAEDVVDGRAFVAAARALVDAGKPVVLLAPGRSEAAVRGAASHTGALTSASHVVDAACVAAGIHRVDNPTQMADLLAALLADRRMRSGRVAVLTDGGGHGAIAADTLASVGLETPVLGGSASTKKRAVLGEGSTVTNPVDLAGAGDRDPLAYARGVAALLAAEEVDAVLLTGYFGGYSTGTTNLTRPEMEASRMIGAAATGWNKPVVVQTIFPGSPSARVLVDAAIPVHRDIDRACDVLPALVTRPAPEPEPVPSPATPLADTSYDAVRALLAGAGVGFVPSRVVHHLDALRRALAEPEMSFPVVLKVVGSLHKSDAGGVVLGLPDATAAEDAYLDLVARLAPPAVSVEVMADLDGGVELIVGCLRDPRFGPVVMVGLGGVFAEVLGDTAVALAPVSSDGARTLLTSLRGAPLLAGARGRAPVDLDVLADLVARVSAVAAAHPELAELEVNPVLATPSGALALDARAVPVASGQDSTSRR